MTTSQRPYLNTLTPLRGIAALFVVIFHSNLMLMSFLPIDKPNIITMGWLWVDFFFVLSGFIISYVYGDIFQNGVTTPNYWRYIKARFARVYPLHVVTMLWCFACALVIVHVATNIHPFFWDMLNPMSVLPSAVLIQSFGMYDGAPLNSPSWSLSTEWWVYMIFPFLTPIFFRLKAIGKWIALGAIVSFFLFIKYKLGAREGILPGGLPSLNLITGFALFRCLAGFLLGMLVYSLYCDSVAKEFFQKSWVFVLFFMTVVILMQLGMEDIIVISLFPFVILTAAYNASGVKKVLDTPILQRLGDWSFSIYMVHVPIIFLFWIYQTIENPAQWAQFPPDPSGAPDATVALGVCCILVFLTLLVAALCYRYVEVPARNYLNQKMKSKELNGMAITK